MPKRPGNLAFIASWSQDSKRMSAEDFVLKYFGLMIMLALVPFTINDLYFERYSVALADTIAILLIAVDFASINYFNRILVPRSLLLLGMGLVLLYVVSEQGIMGIYWSYPYISAIYFVLPHKRALLVNVIFLLGMVPLSYQAVGEAESVRIIITMALNGLVAYIFSTIVENQRRFLAEQAITDVLTGAYNRRHLETRRLELIKESTRHKRRLSTILFDIDHFKMINDDNGHEYGDEVLCAITDKVRARVRTSDQIFRQGGDEFVILLPDTASSEALLIADDIRKLVQSSAFSRAGEITISCGVSEYNAQESMNAWLERADQAMYLAKQQGRNRVCNAETLDS